MTRLSKQLTAEDLPLRLLESQWDALQQVAYDVADEVDIKSEGLSGNLLTQTRFVSEFFRGGADYNEALRQSTILAIANPLAQVAAQGPITKADISTAVSQGLCTLSRHGITHRNLFRIFLFPILLTYFVGFGVILVSHFIVPFFEQIYTEFGIVVSWLTGFFVQLGYGIRGATMPLLVVLFGLPPSLWLFGLVGRKKRQPGMSQLDLLLARKRPTIARWLLHFSLLLEAGLTKEEAIGIASSSSGKRWVSRRVEAWKQECETSDPDEPSLFFDDREVRMADTSIDLPRSPGQIVLLQHVATWYRDSSSSLIEWLVQLLVPLYVFLIMATCVLFMLAMLEPIISVIGSLTGVMPGGFM